MKKCLLGWAIVFALPVIGVAAYKTVSHSFEPKTVDKTISFAVYKENNYRAKAYDCTYAQIHVSLEKVRGSNRMIVWDTTFESKLLKQYPSIENALSKKITVEKVVDKKEHLEVKYLIIYNSKGSILQMQNDSFVTDSCGRLDIGV